MTFECISLLLPTDTGWCIKVWSWLILILSTVGTYLATLSFPLLRIGVVREIDTGTRRKKQWRTDGNPNQSALLNNVIAINGLFVLSSLSTHLWSSIVSVFLIHVTHAFCMTLELCYCNDHSTTLFLDFVIHSFIRYFVEMRWTFSEKYVIKLRIPKSIWVLRSSRSSYHIIW